MIFCFIVKTKQKLTASTKEFWEKAYQSNIGRLIGICYRYTRNHQLSEDLVHDAFLKAIDKSGTFKGEGQFEAWLRRIVVNHTLQHLRDRKKDPHVVDVMPDLMSLHPIEENMPAIKAERFTAAELMEVIDQLPEHHRLVFNLYVFEELTHAQIGSTLGISEGTSKSHLARARRKLQQLLTQKIKEDPNEPAQRKALILLLIGGPNENMDSMFRDTFSDFSLHSQKPLSLESIQFSNQPIFRHHSFLRSTANIIAISSVLSIMLIIALVANKTEKLAQKTPVVKNTVSDTAEKNITPFQPAIATIREDSVIVQTNLKQKPMKTLDSLALALLLSVGLSNEVTANDSMKPPIETYSQVEAKPSADTPVVNPPSNVTEAPHTVRQTSGTFRASSLNWSDKNKEVYFEGQVRVNFKDQRFHGNGSFTLLGKVQLLIVDGQQITVGQKVKLADSDYKLATLDSKEATKKYGDKGQYGAVEITRK
jgi:RNA polymerase sigma factor (sigma-70 family)